MPDFDVGLLMREKTEYLHSLIYHPTYAVNRSILLLGAGYGLRTAIFSLQDIRCDTGGLIGEALYWEDGVIRQATARVPRLLSDERISKKETIPAPEVEELLQKHQILQNKSVGKQFLPKCLELHGMGDFAIPTFPVSSFSQIVMAALRWQHCIVKPANGRQGQGVCYVELSGEALQYHTPTDAGVLTAERWQELCGLWPKYKGYLAQPCLDFHNAKGYAMDFRLLVAHGAAGNWETVAIYPRIGASTVVSNVARGGFIGEAKETLQEEFGDAAEELLMQLNRLARELPAIIEDYTGVQTNCLGIDIGVDRTSLRPYVMEANTFPGAKQYFWQLAEKLVQYLKYLALNGSGQPL